MERDGERERWRGREKQKGRVLEKQKGRELSGIIQVTAVFLSLSLFVLPVRAWSSPDLKVITVHRTSFMFL